MGDEADARGKKGACGIWQGEFSPDTPDQFTAAFSKASRLAIGRSRRRRRYDAARACAGSAKRFHGPQIRR